MISGNEGVTAADQGGWLQGDAGGDCRDKGGGVVGHGRLP